MLADPLQVGGNRQLGWAYDDMNNELIDSVGKADVTNVTETSTSASTSNSYRDEWLRLFERPDYIDVIKQAGLRGVLRSSRFRSVCWRVYLEVLPEDQAQWMRSVRKDREKFAAIKRKYIIDLQTESQCRDADLSLNNPLSQLEDSPWNRFFLDKEIRQEISQDVQRTFPEIEFFQTTQMQDMMVSILFCYCKENDDMGYKQGMHEVLAPLIFILHCDQQAFLHAQEIKSQILVGPGKREVVQELMDPNFLEHDSYMLFFQLMDTMEPWYRHGTRDDKFMIPRNFKSAEPFSKPAECSPSSPLIKKLTKIQEVVLKRHDIELHTQLTRLDIQPQIFGIRWIRLLYGREFTLQDLLVLWDAIFADSQTLDLMDYIFVAMLVLVRALLLRGDYAECMTLLMRFPMVGDVRCLIDKALYLRDPKKYPRPSNNPFQILQHGDAGVVISTSRQQRRAYSNDVVESAATSSSSSSGALAGGSMNAGSVRNKTTPSVMSSGFSSLKRYATKVKQQPSEAPLGKLDKTRPQDSETGENALTSSHPLAVSTEAVSEVKSRPLKVRSPSLKQEVADLQAFSSDNYSVPQKRETQGTLFSKSKAAGKKNQQKEYESELLQQVTCLQGKMNDVQNMCRYCSTKMEAHLMQIQDEMVKLKLTQEDEMLLAVAGLKQVKDILKGTLKFGQGMEEDDDLIITDDYYGLDEQTVTPTDQSQSTSSPDDDNQTNGGSSSKDWEMEEVTSPGVTSSDGSVPDLIAERQSGSCASSNSDECNNGSPAAAMDGRDPSSLEHDPVIKSPDCGTNG